MTEESFDAPPGDEPVTLAECLVALQAQAAGGAVLVSAGDRWTRIYLLDGCPVAVQTEVDAEPTGEADHLWESLVDCLQWVEPATGHDPDDDILPELSGDPLQVEPLILEAVRRQFALPELDAAVGPFMAHRPRLEDDVAHIAERCALYGADEQDFMQLIPRSPSVEDLLVDGPLDLMEAYQLLYGLVLLGAVSLRDPDEIISDEPPVDDAVEAAADGVEGDSLDDEPIDAYADDHDGDGHDIEDEPSLSEDVAAAFEPGLADFLLDVVQATDPPPAPEPAAEREEPPPARQEPPSKELPTKPPRHVPPRGLGARPGPSIFRRSAERSPPPEPAPPEAPARAGGRSRPLPRRGTNTRPEPTRAKASPRATGRGAVTSPRPQRGIVEERDDRRQADSRVAVRTSRKPVGRAARPRPAVTRRVRPTGSPAAGSTPPRPPQRPTEPRPRAPLTPPSDRESRPGPQTSGERHKQLAELHAKKGKRYLYRGNAPRALVELEKALELDSSSVELILFVTWTRFTVKPGDATQAKMTEQDLRNLAVRAVKANRGFGFAHYVLGQLALRDGRPQDAYRSLAKAAKLDPDNQDAERGYQIAKRRVGK